MHAPPGYEEFREAEFERLTGRFLRLRLLLTPLVASLIGPLAWLAPSPRRWLLLALLAGLFVLWVAEIRRGDARPRPGWVLGTLFGIMSLQGSLVLLTGGALSPLIVVLVPLGLLSGVVIGPRRLLAVPIAVQQGVLAVAALGRWQGWLPPGHLPLLGQGLDGPAGAGHDVALTAAVALATLVMTGLGAGLRGVVDGMLWRAFEARQEALRSHRERLGELSALSSELAHELKNPLATISGLAALVDRGLPPGRDRERMEVLRREVGRMADILSEFLTFSRPLLPLDRGPVDADALLRDVVALYEGVAGERGVALQVEGPPGVRLDADGRKLHQVLVNLVQNALDASPRGAVVTLRSSAAGPALVVADRGPGLPAEPEQLFEAGHTTKEAGSGLGLTIARALARQHGGDLTLRPRDGGGAEAVLIVPTEREA